MLSVLAVANYRSLLKLVMPLGRLNVVTGPNGSGKSNLYRALRLLAETAQGGVVGALAHEGGLRSAFWAGPENLTARMRRGEVPVQGGPRQDVMRMRLGFAGEEFGYSISLGLPSPSNSAFALDPEVKRECIWSGPYYRPATALIDRNGSIVKVRSARRWELVAQHVSAFDSMFRHVADPQATPELLTMRESIRAWRFYDHFRTDVGSPARLPQLGTRTPVLHHDGRDVAAALQTIREIGDRQALENAIEDAFPGARLDVLAQDDGRFAISLQQPGLLRPLSGAELSDGTLRYLLWLAALLTPRPPALMVLNEPETSLHPDLLPALARMIVRAAEHTQLWVVSHSSRLIAALGESPQCHAVALEKHLGQTSISGLRALDEPPWHWPDQST